MSGVWGQDGDGGPVFLQRVLHEPGGGAVGGALLGGDFSTAGGGAAELAKARRLVAGGGGTPGRDVRQCLHERAGGVELDAGLSAVASLSTLE